ncbi:MAG: hypothetical protein GY724_22930 [Actinomycetia bacterium]|nr:hypothetical protein [Actinomycetes bacterium]MCP5035056.1 hypothetical protein [Actinomycetes bacterium]
MITALPRIAIAVNDFEQAVSVFGQDLGMPVLDMSDQTVPGLGAHVGMCVPEGGSNIELMAPANPDYPLSQALQKFLDRRGEGVYALMLEAPDPNAEADELLGRGLGVLPLMKGAGGRDIHPRSTHGVLIRIYPDNSVGDTGDHESDKPNLSGITRAILATADVTQAAATYGAGLGLEVGEPEHDDDRGVVAIICRAPKGGVIELVSVVDPERPFARAIDRSLENGGEGLYGLVLRAPDPQSAMATLEDKGVVADQDGLGALSVFGTRMLIE